jgi:hypothetical protein
MRPTLVIFALLTASACGSNGTDAAAGDESHGGSGPSTEPGAGGSSPDGGSSGTKASASPLTSGSRLKGRYLAGADGSKLYVGFRDTQRNENCAFAATDAGLRCLPLAYAGLGTLVPAELPLDAIPVAVRTSVIGGGFADASCTKPISYDFTPLSASNVLAGKHYPASYIFVTHLEADGHSAVKSVFTASWKALGTTLFTLGGPSNTSCNAESRDPRTVLMGDAEVPLTEFAQATEGLDP